MSWARRHLLSPTRIFAVVALVIAVASTAVAANHGDSAADKKLFAKVVRKAAPKLSVGKAKSANKAKSAVSATNAGHATTATSLGGQPLSSYLAQANFTRFSFTLAFGGQRDIASSGPLTLTAKCLQNATDDNGNANRDIARIVISTTQDGAIFDAQDAKRGANAGDFLDTTTPETDRVFTENAIPTATARYEAESNSDGVARAANGSVLGLQQDGVGLGVNVFGPGCVFHGVAFARP
jgi:hypothetical protein